jgi:predicted transcriptional regulator of viral defense system
MSGLTTKHPTFRNMPPLLTQRDQTLSLLERHGVMRLAELKRHGVHGPTLSRLIDEGLVLRSSRGVYQLADTELDFNHSLAEMAKRVPKGVICLISALHYHEITLQDPRVVWMAIGEKDRKPKIEFPPVRFVRFGDKALTTGVQQGRIQRMPVKIFSPAKTVVDCFRYRNTVGFDVALEGLRMALRSKKATPDAIARYANELRVWSIVRPYLESAAADGA